MKKIISNMICILVTVVCILSAVPSTYSFAATSINGGYETKSNAYSWGSYSDSKILSITLPAEQNEMWVKFTLPSNNRIYVRCSYHNDYEGMYLQLYSNTSLDAVDEEYSPNDVKNADTILPFFALNADNTTSSTQTYYIYVNRGTYEGNMYFNYSLNRRIKKGNGTFRFDGTASNPGNKALSLSGVDSSILSLDLRNESKIPPNAIVTSVSTSGTQSPSQGNVHHMILPSTSPNNWYTSIVANAKSGSYNISVDNNFKARQIWKFKYNALASAKSTMRNVSLLLDWEYDIADTNYTIYK